MFNEQFWSWLCSDVETNRRSGEQNQSTGLHEHQHKHVTGFLYQGWNCWVRSWRLHIRGTWTQSCSVIKLHLLYILLFYLWSFVLPFARIASDRCPSVLLLVYILMPLYWFDLLVSIYLFLMYFFLTSTVNILTVTCKNAPLLSVFFLFYLFCIFGTNILFTVAHLPECCLFLLN